MSLLVLGFYFKIPLDTQMRVDSWGKQIFFFFLKEKMPKCQKNYLDQRTLWSIAFEKYVKLLIGLKGFCKKSSHALKGSVDIFNAVRSSSDL